ncbi:MAG: ABC transporter ATP-binding protein [Alphaproteobacteria bacterium]|nr:MAG: ABC transporter ATP-binding protein [Alphaproteobacteria bacterium]
MLTVIKNIRKFTKSFGICGPVQTTMLVGGGVVTSLLELAGLSILFPMLSIILQPDYLHTNPLMQRVSSVTGITSSAHMTMLIGAAISLVFIVKNAFQILYLNYENHILSNWRINISSKLYQAYMNTEYETFMRHSSSRMINMITSNVPFVLNNYVYKSIILLNYLLTGAVILAFVVYVNWLVAALILVTGVSLAMVYTRVYRRRMQALGQTSQEINRAQYSLLQQAFAGYKETQSHLKENIFSHKFKQNAHKLAKTDGKLFFVENLPLALVEMVIMVMLITIFQIVILSGANVTLAITQVGVIVFASLRMIPVINRTLVCMIMINSSTKPLEELMEEVTRLRFSTSALTNYSALNPAPKTEIIAPLPYTRTLEITNLSYTYPETSEQALSDVSFVAEPGQFIGITGPSGSGKSTLVNILLGFLSSFEGKFTVDGIPVTRANIRSLRQIIGFVDQNIFILDATVAENVAYGHTAENIDREQVKAALAKAQLLDMVEALPQGMDTPVGENGKLLSGGQRQRLVIARAFYRNLKILVLDEASAALDVETEHKLFTYLQTLKGELTVIMIAHRLSTLKECDHIFFMENGTFTAKGTFSQLEKNSPVFRNYLAYNQLNEPRA